MVCLGVPRYQGSKLVLAIPSTHAGQGKKENLIAYERSCRQFFYGASKIKYIFNLNKCSKYFGLVLRLLL